MYRTLLIMKFKKINGNFSMCFLLTNFLIINQMEQKHRMSVFENRVLGRIFGPKRDEVTGGWRKLHNLYSSPSIFRMIKLRRMKWAAHVARMGEKRNAYRILVIKPEGNRPLARPRRRWLYNIKLDLREIGWDVVDWLDMAQDRD
jgi:hypothetical protein